MQTPNVAEASSLSRLGARGTLSMVNENELPFKLRHRETSQIRLTGSNQKVKWVALVLNGHQGVWPNSHRRKGST